MADYGCYPLWHDCDHEVGNIDPASLPISTDLVALLNEWAEEYNLTLNRSDPSCSGFLNPQAEIKFKKNGEFLLKKLQTELGSKYKVTYQE